MKHLYFDNCYYFVTRSTFSREKLFNSDNEKRIILNRLISSQKKFNFSLNAFSILANHYHYLIFLPQGNILPKLEQFIAGGSAYELNHLANVSRRVWSEYWEKVVNEENLEKILGYILGNLLKHKEISDFNELQVSPFSSYRQAIIRYGKEAVEDLVLSTEGLDLENKTDFEKLFKSINAH